MSAGYSSASYRDIYSTHSCEDNYASVVSYYSEGAASATAAPQAAAHSYSDRLSSPMDDLPLYDGRFVCFFKFIAD